MNDVGIIAGIAVGLLGLCIQWYYGRKRNRAIEEQAVRDAEWHKIRVARAGRADDIE